jgi:hypothetical protein
LYAVVRGGDLSHTQVHLGGRGSPSTRPPPPTTRFVHTHQPQLEQGEEVSCFFAKIGPIRKGRDGPGLARGQHAAQSKYQVTPAQNKYQPRNDEDGVAALPRRDGRRCGPSRRRRPRRLPRVLGRGPETECVGRRGGDLKSNNGGGGPDLTCVRACRGVQGRPERHQRGGHIGRRRHGTPPPRV